MKNPSRHASVFLALLLMLISVLTGCRSTVPDYGDITVPGATASVTAKTTTLPGSQLPVMDVTVFAEQKQSPFNAPTDLTLWDTIRSRAAAAAGYQMNIRLTPWDNGDNDALYKMLSGNNLPDVALINTSFIAEADESILTLLNDGKLFRTLSPKDFHTNMPAFIQRLKEYGVDFDTEFLPAQTKNGLCWYIPAFGMTAPSKLPEYYTNPLDTFIGQQMYSTFSYDNLILRDDILKMIYPDAKSEAELSRLYIDQKGRLNVQDVTGDIPIRTLDDLRGYLVKVRDLNLKTSDGNSLIPACLSYPLMAAGLYDRYPVTFGQDLTKGCSYLQSSEFKILLQWLNEAYQSGLMDMFNTNSADVYAAFSQGKYAVMSGEGTSDAALDMLRGTAVQGVRLLPMGFGVIDWDQNNNKYIEAGTATSTWGIFLNARLSDEKAAAIMKWLDYQMSEEFDELCYWGLPEWSTGKGLERRFTGDHAMLEEWTVNGLGGLKEGTAVGLMSVPITLSQQYSNFSLMPPDVKLVSFFPERSGYPDAPCYVTPLSAAKLEGANLLTACDQVMITQDIRPHQVRYRMRSMWDVITDPFAGDDRFDYRYYHDPNVDGRWYPMNASYLSNINHMPYSQATAAIVTGKTSAFEKNWKALQDALAAEGVPAKADAASQNIAAHWQACVLDRVIE